MMYGSFKSVLFDNPAEFGLLIFYWGFLHLFSLAILAYNFFLWYPCLFWYQSNAGLGVGILSLHFSELCFIWWVSFMTSSLQDSVSSNLESTSPRRQGEELGYIDICLFVIFFQLESNFFAYCIGFCHTTTWLSHKQTYIPSLSTIPPYPTPLSGRLKKRQRHINCPLWMDLIRWESFDWQTSVCLKCLQSPMLIVTPWSSV